MEGEIREFVLKLRNAMSRIYEHTSYNKNVLNPLLISSGWYPNTVTFRHKLRESETIDSFMERCILGKYYNQFKYDYIIKKYSNRKDIFEEAFNLFESERYIACIPLFLSQIDGIIIESGLKGFFLGDVKIKENRTKEDLKYIEYLNKYSKDDENGNLEVLVKKILLSFYECAYTKGGSLSISRESSQIKAQEIGFFNRHGILHGNSDYLQYGTKINAIKAISLLLFVIQTLDILNHDFNETQL